MTSINVVCFGNHSGYAQAAQDLILAIHQSGKYDVRVQYIHASTVRHQTGVSADRKALLDELAAKPWSDDRIQVYHCIPPAQRHTKPTRRNLGYAMFETFEPPNDGPMNWVKILNTNDGIIVPSLFCQRIFAHEKVTKPIYYVPCCYDKTIYNRNIEALEKYDRFTFLFFGTWKLRKGYPQMIEAFYREFSSSDKVQLVIKTDKPMHAQSYVSDLKNKLGFSKKDTAPILFEKRIFNEEDLPRFFKSVDCFISPTLGEGFGLPGLQCMALGVPVAITKFSGVEDYANEQTSTLIPHEGFVLHDCLDNLPQFSRKKWAFVSVASIQRTMREVLNNQDQIRAKANFASDWVEERFSYEQTEKAFAEMLRDRFNV